MTTPKRIQRKRTKGWRMPENTVYVGRGTRWGNPFRVTSHRDPDNGSTTWWVEDPTGERWGPYPLGREKRTAQERVVDLYGLHTGPLGNYEYSDEDLDALRRDLGGKDLACWCPLDQPCHADVLLDLANG